MCWACKKYGKRLVLRPIDDREQKMWDTLCEWFGEAGPLLFHKWHRWFVK